MKRSLGAKTLVYPTPTWIVGSYDDQGRPNGMTAAWGGIFFYSLDGTKFTQLGEEVQLLFSGFTPNMVGFYTMNTEEKGYLDVDWFKYDYDGPNGRQKRRNTP